MANERREQAAAVDAAWSNLQSAYDAWRNAGGLPGRFIHWARIRLNGIAEVDHDTRHGKTFVEADEVRT